MSVRVRFLRKSDNDNDNDNDNNNNNEEDEEEDNDNDDTKEEEDDNNNLSTNFFGFVGKFFWICGQFFLDLSSKQWLIQIQPK